LKIKKTYVAFTGCINPGRYALFVDVDKYGVDVSVEQMVLTCVNYNRIVLMSSTGDVLEQNDDIVDLIKKVHKKNDKTVFEMHTLGTKRPKGFTGFGNIEFIVHIQLKNSGKEFIQRIFGELITWFNDCDSKFKFNILSKDDFDEVNLLVNDFCIKRCNVFLCPMKLDNTSLENVKEMSKAAGYNITLDFDKVLW
jgi:hypothetical protein